MHRVHSPGNKPEVGIRCAQFLHRRWCYSAKVRAKRSGDETKLADVLNPGQVIFYEKASGQIRVLLMSQKKNASVKTQQVCAGY